MKFVLIPIFLFSVVMAQLAPANLCLCSFLPCINNTSSHQGKLCCLEESCENHDGEESCENHDREESCENHDGEESNACPSKEKNSSHSCPFEQNGAVSEYVGSKRPANCDTCSELVFHESSIISEIIFKETKSYFKQCQRLHAPPLYLLFQSLLI